MLQKQASTSTWNAADLHNSLQVGKLRQVSIGQLAWLRSLGACAQAEPLQLLHHPGFHLWVLRQQEPAASTLCSFGMQLMITKAVMSSLSPEVISISVRHMLHI